MTQYPQPPPPQAPWVPYATPAPLGPPGVLPWFKGYAILMALLYLVVAAAGFVLALTLPGEATSASAACGPDGCALSVRGVF